jgi:uncharacterized membrane protein
MSTKEESKALADRGTADVYQDGDTVRRSVTIRRPQNEVKQAWNSAGITGTVSFATAPGDRGTEVWVIASRDSQNALHELIGAYKSDDPGASLHQALRDFKARLETGEVATTHGQPSGREALDS